VNQSVNSSFFVTNEPGETVEYDGFTVPLLAKLAVTPGVTYHVRVAISDITDAVFDSGVFLSVESLGSDSLLEVVSAFTYNPTSPSSTIIHFNNESLWGTSYLWDFGDGETSTEKHPTHTFDRGEYNVSLTVKNYCSVVTYNTMVLTGDALSTQQPNAASFTVSPNPAHGNIQLQLAEGDAADVRLFRTDGKLLFDNALRDGSTIHLDAYGKGMYILQVSRNGAIYTQKVVNN
jgi:PKD repeat protein